MGAMSAWRACPSAGNARWPAGAITSRKHRRLRCEPDPPADVTMPRKQANEAHMDMDENELKEMLDVHTQSIQGLVENQMMLAAQVQVLQAALATVLLHHPDRGQLLRTFKGYMKISKESTPQLSRHMEALEGGMLALL